MTHQSISFLLILAGMLLLPEFAGASRLTGISGAISETGDKFAQLKTVSLYAGVFFAVSGTVLVPFRRKLDVHLAVPIVILLLGVGLVGLGLL